MNLRDESGRKELGRRIQTAIAQAGYSSLPAFAEALGWSRALIYQYISGSVLVQLDRLSEIAELTGRSLDWFITEDPGGASGEVKRLEKRVSELTARCEKLEAALGEERGGRIRDAEAARRTLLEALQELCLAQRQAGDMPGLMRSAARCEDVARAVADTGALMIAHLQTGHAALAIGRRDRAEEALRAALNLADFHRHERGTISARQELIRLMQAAGRLDEAREQADELATSVRWWPRWAARVALAAIDEQAGALKSAEQHLDAAAQVIFGEDRQDHYVAMAEVYLHSNRVNLALARGDYAEAARQSEVLETMAAEAQLPDQVREAVLNRAIAALRSGDLRCAEELLGRVRDWAAMSSNWRMAGLAAVFEAERLLRAGEAAQARRLAQQAIEMGDAAVNGQIVAEAELVLGLACLADGQTDDAAYHLGRCRDRADRLKLRRVEVAARLGEGRALTAAGDAAGAESALGEALAMAQASGFRDLTDEASRALDELAGAYVTGTKQHLGEDSR